MSALLVSAADGPRNCLRQLFDPVDIASLIVFRVGFGLMVAGWALHYLWIGRVRDMYVVPRFHFTYPGLEFITPWSGVGMQIHFVLIAFLGLMAAAGLLYRAATTLLALAFTYVFLLDRANYQNHYYLLALISWSMPWMPLQRAWSLDVLNGNAVPSGTIPAWCLWLTRFHVGLPYFFGGIAKIGEDWLAGEPMRSHLATTDWRGIVGDWLATDAVAYLLSWGGLAFDLAVVPLLLWRRTRGLAYIASVGFHLVNSQLFQIHVFPWFMIVATTVFFEPDWPRRLLRRRRVGPEERTSGFCWTARRKWGVAIAGCYVLLQLLLPFRHLLYRGDTNWTEQGHHFAWRMMLRGKTSGVRFLVVDRQTRETLQIDLLQFITPEQLTRMARDPEMIADCARQLRQALLRSQQRDFEVHAIVLCSLNGRKPQLLVDPEVDLSQVTRNSWHRPWVLPLTEPLPAVPWTIPVADWEKYIALPELSFLKTAPGIESGRSPAATRGPRADGQAHASQRP